MQPMMINGSEAEKYVMSYSWPNRSKLSEAAIWSINDTPTNMIRYKAVRRQYLPNDSRASIAKYMISGM